MKGLTLWGWDAIPMPYKILSAGMRIDPDEVSVAGLQSIEEVDVYVNTNIKYSAEKEDEWARPAETLARGYGDCEDFALLKIAILRSMGKDAVLLLVKDLIARQDHAVVLCEGRILDTFNTLALPAEEVSDYRPVMALAPGKVWIYGRAGK